MIVNNKNEQYLISMPFESAEYKNMFNGFKKYAIAKDITLLATDSATLLGSKYKFSKVTINNIISKLKNVNTKYVIVNLFYDVLICKDLNSEFIDKLLSLNDNFICAGAFFNMPTFNLENWKSLVNVGNQKYINGSLIIGKTKEVLKFISIAIKEYNKFKKYTEDDFTAWQLAIRLLFNGNCDYVDANNLICSTIQYPNSFIVEKDANYYEVYEARDDKDYLF